MDHRYPPDFNDARNVWGHRFQWTPIHQTAPDLSPLLYSYDKLATDALDRLDLISPPTSKGWKCPHGSGPSQRDLYELLKKYANSDIVLGQLWSEVSTVPEWVDWEQLERGQQVVYRFSGQILFGLLYKSLLGGMGAYRVVETLSRTGGFGVNVTRRRLLETLQHFMEVIEDIDAIKPGGKGYISSVRVRLLHAAVRRRLMQLEQQNPGYYDMDKWGVPINDLHTMATISVYSVAIVYVALPRQGIYLTARQTADYFALWRYVGYLLGTPIDWMATSEQAKALWESIDISEIAPSANSQILANNILTAEARAPPLNLPREVLAAHAYRLNGDELAGALGIEKPALRFRVVVWLQCAFLFFLSYSYPLLSTPMQKRREQLYRVQGDAAISEENPSTPLQYERENVVADAVQQRFKAFANFMIRNEKAGGLTESSTFEFQYLPRLGMLTELGVRENQEAEKSASADLSKTMIASKRAVFVIGAFIGAMAVL
ncbi:Latex clearing protein [Fusarium austroafricanum]|uniref:Latex clearing protein n=1 Tax=Fusarium austroafricanum TaxID=2364996 RepID=A0A8H4KKP9_9HYPO|nr:Latex clearing protein [Fusarium austroafricanum]